MLRRCTVAPPLLRCLQDGPFPGALLATPVLPSFQAPGGHSFTTVFPPTSDPGISEVRPLKDWDAVRHEISQWKHHDPSTLAASTVLHSMQILGSPPQDIDIPLVVRHATNLLPHLDAQTASSLFYWSCKMRQGDAQFRAALAEKLTQEMSHHTPKHLVLMLYGCGWLVRFHKRLSKEDPPEEFFPGMTPFVDKVARALTEPPTLIQLKEQDLANTVYSFGLLKYHVNEVLYPLLSRIEQPMHLPRFLEQEIVNMLQGLASLELAEHPTVAVLAAEAIERERLRIYKETELCSLFQSLALLRYSNPDAIGVLLHEAIRSGRMGHYTEDQISNLVYSIDRLNIHDDRVWRLLLNEISGPERLTKFKPHHLANVLYAIGRSSYRDSDVMQRLGNVICQESHLETYSTREFSLMMYGMSQIGFRNLALLSRMAKELAKPGRLLEKGLVDKTLSGMLLSFATLRFKDLDLLHRYFMEVLIKDRMDQMHPDVLAQYVFCLGKFKMPFDGATREVVLELLQSRPKLEAMPHRGLGMMIYGLGQMGTDVGPYMETLVSVLNEGIGKVERFSVQDLAMIIYSFGLIRLEQPELIDRMLQTFTRPDRLVRASTQHLSNVMYGLGLLRHSMKDMVVEMMESEMGRDSRVRCYTSQELANMIFSISLLQIDHRPGIQRLIEKLTIEGVKPERLAQFQEMELNCFLTGLSNLGYREPNVVVPLLEEIVHSARLERLKDKEIVSVLHVIANLGICPDEICEKLLVEARSPTRMKRYDMNSLVMMIYSLGQLRNENYHEAVQAFSEKLLQEPGVDALGEQHLSNFLYGVAHARFEAPEVLKGLFHEITKHHRLPRFQCVEILNVMKSVMQLKSREVAVEGLDHVARIFAIEMTALSRIPRYSAGQLTHVLAFLAALRNKNVATVFPILQELTKADVCVRLMPADVSRAVFSVGPLAFVNQKLHPKLALAVKPLLKQAVLSGGGTEVMHCQSLTELLVGVSMLGLRDDYLLDNLSNEIVRSERLRSFRAWQLSRIFYALAQLRYQNLELLRALAAELSKPDRAQRLDYRHWSNILTAVLMLKFRDEDFAKVIEKQIYTPQGTPQRQQSM